MSVFFYTNWLRGGEKVDLVGLSDCHRPEKTPLSEGKKKEKRRKEEEEVEEGLFFWLLSPHSAAAAFVAPRKHLPAFRNTKRKVNSAMR